GDEVLHVVDGELPGIGSAIAGTVDRARRREHMALHTGQHILSRALADEAEADTVSSRLGETACTIDVDRDRIDDVLLGRALDLANAVIDDDHPVNALFPSPEELAALPLRREAKVEGPIRIVRVGDFDVTPCGGTHCTRSGQVGLVEITGLERRKRRLRITFVAGRRARRQLGDEARAMREVARSLSCAPLEVASAFDRLRGQVRDAHDATKEVEDLLASTVAARLPVTDGRVVAYLDGLTPEIAREVAKRVAEEADALLAAPTAGGIHVVLARSAGSTFDCGAFLRQVAEEVGGKGGGRPERAEGRLPEGVDWVSVCDDALRA
ncbi:MAG: DHHA1 domain-containing protein, partial [Polyangiaceae bacterium]